MLKRLLACLAVWLIVAGAATAAWAELESVSGVGNTEVFADGDPASVELFPPAGPGAGFPLWYKDTNGLKLTLCVDGEEGEAPCAKEGSPVFTDDGCTQVLYPYQNVVGFGDEALLSKNEYRDFGHGLTRRALQTGRSDDHRRADATGCPNSKPGSASCGWSGTPGGVPSGSSSQAQRSLC